MAKNQVLAILTIFRPFFRNDFRMQCCRSSNFTRGECFQISKIHDIFWVISEKLKLRRVYICLGHDLPIERIIVKIWYTKIKMCTHMCANFYQNRSSSFWEISVQLALGRAGPGRVTLFFSLIHVGLDP